MSESATRQPDRPAAGAPPESEFFDLQGALRAVCDQAHHVLGWHVVLLIRNDESAGLSCVTAAAGVSEEARELLLGMGLCASDELARWLDGHPRINHSYVLN